MSSSYRLGSNSLFTRSHENSKKPKRVVFLSTEGTKTEVQYFKFIERYKKELEIDAIVHIEVLKRYDTNSDPENVLGLLEEFITLRDNIKFEEIVNSLNLKDYPLDFIMSYLDNPSNTNKKYNKFEETLRREKIDLMYLYFLSKFQGENDSFGIVIDRDCGSHSIAQINNVVAKCKHKNISYYISNPCFEFWQLLHVSDVKSEYSEVLEDIYKNELDERKNSFVSNLLYEKTNQRKSIQKKLLMNIIYPI